MAEGTNKKLVRDIVSSLSSRRQDSERIEVASRKLNRQANTIAATLGTGHDSTEGVRGGGGGAVGDMVEQNAGTRTFHAVPRLIASTDGVFEIEIRDLKTIELEDSTGAVTVFEFAQPS